MAYNRTLHHLISSQDVVSQWATGQSYVQNQLIVDSSKLYQCITNHTSGATFAGDSAYWSGIEPTGLVDISAGGTGQTTATAAFDALAPTTTAGDIVVHNGTDNVRQGIGSDGQVLVVDTSQTNKLKWTNLQQGAKNYITYGTFENGATTGWSLSHSTLDATTKLPNQASGSWTSATSLAISAISSGQLAGSYSLQLSGTASTTAGDMLVTDALTLDLEAQASIQTFSFFYKVTANGTGTPNFSGTSSNAIGVAIYDVTNSTWIQPAGVFNIVQSSGVGKASGTFQCPSNCTSVRLAVYFPNSTAASGGSPFTVVFDDFVLGPQVVQYGAPVTDWQSFTPTVTNSTGAISNYSSSALWRRVGGDMEVVGSIVFSAASGAFTDLIVSVPSFATIDTTKSFSQKLGTGSAYDAAIAIYEVDLVLNSSTKLTIYAVDSSIARAGLASVTNTSPFTFNTGDQISYSYKVPISGWSSSVQMSNDTDTRVVAASFYKSAAQNITSGSTTVIEYDALKSGDTHGAFNTTTFRYTAPQSGWYRISATIGFAINSTGSRGIGFRVNGGIDQWFGAPAVTAGDYGRVSGSTEYYLNSGDYVQFITFQNSGGLLGIYVGQANSFASVARLSGPATIAASETVACSFNTSSSVVTGSGTWSLVTYTNKIVDTHGIYNTSTGAATIPVSGIYRVIHQMRGKNVLVSGEYGSVHFTKNGTSFTEMVAGHVVSGATGATSKQSIGPVTWVGPLVAGDIIRMSMDSNSASFGPSTAGQDPIASNFSIQKL